MESSSRNSLMYCGQMHESGDVNALEFAVHEDIPHGSQCQTYTHPNL